MLRTRNLATYERFRMLLKNYSELRKEIENNEIGKKVEYYSFFSIFKIFKPLGLRRYFEKEDYEFSFNLARLLEIAYNKMYCESGFCIKDNIYSKEELIHFLNIIDTTVEANQRYTSYLFAGIPFFISIVSLTIAVFTSLFSYPKWFIAFIFLVITYFLGNMFQIAINLNSKLMLFSELKYLINRRLSEGF